jgi:S-adenosylmethionine:tRNA ribosyltransferase-isomerase
VHISDFDYDLPEELIAQSPLSERDASRMLIVNREDGTLQDSVFTSLPDQLRLHDILVLNNTKVFPARLVGERIPTGGSVEFLLLNELETNVWRVLARPARRLRVGARISFGNESLEAEVINAADDGTRIIRFETENLREVIDQIGQIPLPPYIKRDQGTFEKDQERYQTVYAAERGAIAAPTAGLHFTPKVLSEIEEAGIKIAKVTLHVGYGTFEPVRGDDVSAHHVAPEHFTISDDAAKLINDSRNAGGRVVCVGTTTARALESAASENGHVGACSRVANLTIIPGYTFRAVDVLLTNFHLPRSSLLLLVSAFAGRDLILKAYQHAVSERYRFYSYGDCMLIS